MLHYIVPIYNKEKDLIQNIETLDKFLAARLQGPYEIILSDDGSVDHSAEIAGELAAANPRVRAMGYPVNRGRGSAIKFAAQSCPEGSVIYSDLDFPKTTRLDWVLEMNRRLAEYPIVIGSRFHPRSRTQRRWRRDLIGKAHRLTLRFFFPRLDLSDPDMGFKGFRQPEFGRINRLSRLNRWSWDLEVLVIARCNGLSIDEIPVDWQERYEGYSSTVRLWQDSREEFEGMLAIRRNLRRGLYDF